MKKILIGIILLFITIGSAFADIVIGAIGQKDGSLKKNDSIEYVEYKEPIKFNIGYFISILSLLGIVILLVYVRNNKVTNSKKNDK